MKNFLFVLIIFVSTNCNWWLYDSDDHAILFDKNSSPEEKLFIEDQLKCSGKTSCYLANSKLNSTGNFENKCCLLKTSGSLSYCYTIFSGKYFESNLYSISYYLNNNFTYDCDGKGDKTYNPSLYQPKENWEILIKERYDCIYSETEKKCQENPKSFVKNTKCCWFSPGCFGVKDLTDNEFNKIVPYMVLSIGTNKTLNFHCYDKSDKIVNGTFDLDLSYIMMQNYDKMSFEMESEESLYLFSKKQSFIGIKDYETGYNYNYFRIYTASPNSKIDYVFTICTRFKFNITSSRIRNLQSTDEEYIEQIVKCTPETVDNNSKLNITVSNCVLSKEGGKDVEEIIIQKGNDLIGNIDENNNLISKGKQFMNDNDIKKIKESATFTFKNASSNIKTNIIEGETTLDRKNVEFVLYYSKDSKVQTIKAKGSFLKNTPTVSFTMNPSVNLKEGITIIPNQVCKDENGEYLYIQNKLGIIQQNNATDMEDSEDSDGYFHFFSSGIKLSISYYGILIAILLWFF